MKEISASKLAICKVSWNQLFDSENELIATLLAINVNSGIVPCGYQYLQSFKKRLINKQPLTDGQMKQLKRLAKNVYASYKGYMIGGMVTRI